MVENSPLRWNDPTNSTYGQGPAQEFSATKFIGGSLRALYDDAMQPCPTRLTELLYELAAIEDSEGEMELRPQNGIRHSASIAARRT